MPGCRVAGMPGCRVAEQRAEQVAKHAAKAQRTRVARSDTMAKLCKEENVSSTGNNTCRWERQSRFLRGLTVMLESIYESERMLYYIHES